ncbi:MAG: hypothetical protein LBH39_03650 [Clostridiales Family XIII bacterium]|jgi:hypothetical protein|nr:hypothetical protein [Clostridiales Family XIII bacterium]
MIMKKFCPLLLAAMLVALSGAASYAGTISDNNVGGVTPDFAVIGSINTDLIFQRGFTGKTVGNIAELRV